MHGAIQKNKSGTFLWTTEYKTPRSFRQNIANLLHSSLALLDFYLN